MRGLLLLLLLPASRADMNSYQVTCEPSDNTVDGQFYCADKRDGWYDLGASKVFSDMNSNSNSLCRKYSNDCHCPDCGRANTQCKDWRCDDDNGFWDQAAFKCYTINGNGERSYTDKDPHYNCYKTRTACDHAQCQLSQHLVGCKRYSAGSCVACPAAADRHYFTRKGYCDTAQCSPLLPGKFVLTACSNLSNVVLADCDAYPGNPKSVAVQANPRFYCPGNGLVLPLPAFSLPTADYSGFRCIDGYFLIPATSSCQQCPQGSACLYGREFVCPEGYFQNRPGQAVCKRCTVKCGNGQVPYKCEQGSTADVGCVPCGMCGYSATTGHRCDQLPDSSLPAECRPQDVPGGVAQCS